MSRAAGGEIAVKTNIHEATGLILILLDVGGQILWMVLDTGTNLSGIGQRVRNNLFGSRYLQEAGTFQGELLIFRKIINFLASGICKLCKIEAKFFIKISEN